MTVKEALTVLSSLQSTQVIPALRHTDFVMVAALAFQGFRMDAGGFANPIVRRRLAEEAAKNSQFATKLRDLAKEPPPKATSDVKQAAEIRPAAQPLSVDLQSRRELEKYRAERDRLKQERDSAIQAKQGAERLLTEAKRELILVQTSKVEADREVERVKQRLERVERKQRQLETTNATLRRAAVLPPPASVSINQQPPAPTAPKLMDERHFVEAIRRLLTKDRDLVALSLVNDVLRSTPDDVDALDIKAEALIKTDKPREAVAVLRSAIGLHLKHDEALRAAVDLYRLLMISAQPVQESKLIREFMAALQRSPENPGRLVEPIVALRTDNVEAFKLVKSLTPPSLLNFTFPEQVTFPPDAALPLNLNGGGGIAVTARRLVQAIDRNEQAIVELTQEALKDKDKEEREKILLSVRAAADGDAVYGRVLTPKFSRGAIVVDSSNVAWHGQEMLAQQQPRLEFILSIRRTLREMGYFPILLVADANLPYVINDSATVRKMVDEDQIQLVISGSDADEQILREAQRLHAPIVSNDYMADWDPEQRITKIQYSFTPDGKPSIYF